MVDIGKKGSQSCGSQGLRINNWHTRIFCEDRPRGGSDQNMGHRHHDRLFLLQMRDISVGFLPSNLDGQARVGQIGEGLVASFPGFFGGIHSKVRMNDQFIRGDSIMGV